MIGPHTPAIPPLPTDRDTPCAPGSPFAAGPWIDASEPPEDETLVLCNSQTQGVVQGEYFGGRFIGFVPPREGEEVRDITLYAIINAPEGHNV